MVISVLREINHVQKYEYYMFSLCVCVCAGHKTRKGIMREKKGEVYSTHVIRIQKAMYCLEKQREPPRGGWHGQQNRTESN